ncbi:MAG: HDIG domain-containing protein [Calditrichaeota bacterium]|nr:HDIG domain-containing protein [Candidatus Cloacimonadota bacterium]MCA9786923.1 HDIG domain-containing protein [Candidatus Cloacimonadota bacterium]MCB1048176.1 HDIG domain-containing protein [Calditrichota bacterium]MCB9473627.1 HDIG domain-containing protein [Candidatus Delongbacteria bacterium]
MYELPDRVRAWELLCLHTQSESLRKHALAVEALMGAHAREAGEDADLWERCGLLHDFDYERWPDPAEHTVQGGKILEEAGYPPELIRAIHSHNPGNGLGVPLDTAMARTLFAVDELAGFLVGVALVRPSRSLHDLEPRSVIKKFKDRAFCAAVSREDMTQGAELLGRTMDVHLAFCISALRPIADELGLAGH